MRSEKIEAAAKRAGEKVGITEWIEIANVIIAFIERCREMRRERLENTLANPKRGQRKRVIRRVMFATGCAKWEAATVVESMVNEAKDSRECCAALGELGI